MSFKTIRDAVSTVAPTVRESLEIHRAKREEVRANPEAHSPAARTRAQRGWNRVVIEETVWAIAKNDLLASPEQRAVIEAAKAWAQTWQNDVVPNPEHDDPADCALFDAVMALVREEEDVEAEAS